MELRQFIQVAYVVDDLDAAMERWLRSARSGPFFVGRNYALTDYLYRDKPAPAHRMSFALCQAGAVQIELIQQLDEHPSAYRDAFPRGSEGMHHLCTYTSDFEGELRRQEALGFPVAHRGSFGDLPVAYVDTRPVLGCMIEYIADTPEVRAVHAKIARSAVDWDGSDPIRSF